MKGILERKRGRVSERGRGRVREGDEGEERERESGMEMEGGKEEWTDEGRKGGGGVKGERKKCRMKEV